MLEGLWDENFLFFTADSLASALCIDAMKSEFSPWFVAWGEWWWSFSSGGGKI